MINIYKLDILSALGEVWRSTGIVNLTIGQIAMICVGLILLYLAIKKDFEPLLLVPIGIGAILANIPIADIAAPTVTFVKNLDPQTLGTYGGNVISKAQELGISSENLNNFVGYTSGSLTAFGGLIGQLYGFGVESGLFPYLYLWV
jgi:carboxybiotin decarboxylase